MFQRFKNNKKLLGIYILNVCIFLLLGALYFALLASRGEAAYFLSLGQKPNFLSQLSYSINPGFLTFAVLLFQILLITVINQKYLKTRRQVIIVNALLFVTFFILIAIQLIPVVIRRGYCSTVIRSHTKESGECMTFIENSKVAVVYIMAAFYLALYSLNATGIQLLLFLTKNKMKIIFLTLLSLAITGSIIILPSRYITARNIQVKPYPKQTIPSTQLEINNKNQSIDPKIHQLQSGEIDNSNIFSVLPKELQVKDSTITINSTTGFIIVNSILSNGKDRIVYSEISDCIKSEQDYGTRGQCDWKYRIYVKKLGTNNVIKLYGYPEDKLSWADFLIPKVNAGGCPLVYLPIGWSKNDKKIILQSVNPTSCGAGGGTTKYLYASVNSDGGSIEGISNSQTKFYDKYNRAIFVGESEKSPPICEPINQLNNGKLVFFNTETRQEIKSIEESNTDYTLGEVSVDGIQVEYFTKMVTEKNGCA